MFIVMAWHPIIRFRYISLFNNSFPVPIPFQPSVSGTYPSFPVLTFQLDDNRSIVYGVFLNMTTFSITLDCYRVSYVHLTDIGCCAIDSYRLLQTTIDYYRLLSTTIDDYRRLSTTSDDYRINEHSFFRAVILSCAYCFMCTFFACFFFFCVRILPCAYPSASRRLLFRVLIRVVMLACAHSCVCSFLRVPILSRYVKRFPENNTSLVYPFQWFSFAQGAASRYWPFNSMIFV